MKKTVIIGLIILVALLYVFSPWKKQHISSAEAVECTMQMLDDKSKETIINLNNPKVEEVVFDKIPPIYLWEEKSDAVRRKLYKIAYNTQQDGLLGPIVFYVDKLNGKIVGMDYRE